MIAYAEAKDITVSLDETAKSEQLERYYGYSNLILTNYLQFRFYRNGQPYGDPIKIAEIKENRIIPIEANFSSLEDALKDFLEQAREPITSGVILSKVMAGKGRRIRDNIKSFLKAGDEKKNESLLSVYNVIKKLLLVDLDYEKFADMFAQTLVYGLFVARFYDKTQDAFTRQSARDLVPASNPFLRNFFDHIVGPDFDKRLEYIVNELCEIFSHANVQGLMSQYFAKDLFGETHEAPDPVIHFYEDFLKEYDPELRKKDGSVYINEKQYFGKVPEAAWNFYIGGYQPAQKWLKDRKGRKLTNDEIEHYQKIIIVLMETDRIMKQIDNIF